MNKKSPKPAPQRKQTILAEWNDCDDYELLDFGGRRKIERFGKYTIVRDEPKAWLKPALSPNQWKNADAIHSDSGKAGWSFLSSIEREWNLRFDDLTFQARISSNSKQVGVFPENIAHWRWMRKQIQQSKRSSLDVLNLFAYTGAASLAAAKEGCRVTHVDSARGVIEWAKVNQKLSGLEDAPIRWIADDCMKFVKREARRNRKYDAIILDPPAFGRGPKGEVWKVEKDLLELLNACRNILSDKPIFIVLTMYSTDQSSILLEGLLRELTQDFSGSIQTGELILKPRRAERKLSMSIFGRWSC